MSGESWERPLYCSRIVEADDDDDDDDDFLRHPLKVKEALDKSSRIKTKQRRQVYTCPKVK